MKALLPNSKATGQLIKEECDRRIDQLLTWHTSCVALVLLDKGHIPPEEIQTILEQISDQYNSITRGYVTFEGLHQALKDDYGVNLHFIK